MFHFYIRSLFILPPTFSFLDFLYLILFHFFLLILHITSFHFFLLTSLLLIGNCFLFISVLYCLNTLRGFPHFFFYLTSFHFFLLNCLASFLYWFVIPFSLDISSSGLSPLDSIPFLSSNLSSILIRRCFILILVFYSLYCLHFFFLPLTALFLCHFFLLTLLFSLLRFYIGFFFTSFYLLDSFPLAFLCCTLFNFIFAACFLSKFRNTFIFVLVVDCFFSIYFIF
ncbi:PIGN [Acanthosepion pharaonis]|uniref:PIGN n=1 Tax=Acanthosepion pharaonis TaxID=158019 RepID=A0A812AXJ8_ACAPH|nr:PIGN [Sepia pharaonis]